MPFDDQGGRGPNTHKIDDMISEQPFMDNFDNVLFAYIAGWDTTKGQLQSVTNRIIHTSGGSDLPVVVVKILNFLKKEQQV